MKVEHSGWYRTRDGRLAEVVYNPRQNFGSFSRAAHGYIEGEGCTRMWAVDGHYCDYEGPSVGADLIEYLGKERPKQKKTVKMAPALVRGGHYAVSNYFYESESKARTGCAGFVRWLIDTHAVEVEVDE
jgi:hypothetical protein